MKVIAFSGSIPSCFRVSFMWSASFNNINENTTIYNDSHGVLLDESSNNTIIGNSVAYNYYCGLYVRSSSFNDLTENTIAHNDYIVWLLDSAGNVFYHNNFIDNAYSVRISPSDLANTWDNGYPSGGNHWSDYTGVDADGDGIGDTPYIINADNRDNYPLMNGYVFGDINYDGLVDIRDLYALAKAYMSTPTSPTWNARADLNKDNTIDNADLAVFTSRYGKIAPK